MAYDGFHSSMGQEAVPLEELIARARAGDQAAMRQLFTWSAPLLEDWASRRLRRKQPDITRPSDLVQEASDRASRGISSFRGTTTAEWLSWLESIVETCAIQSFRAAARKKRDRTGEVPLDEEKHLVPQLSPSQAAADEEQWRQVFGRIFELPEEQKTAIWLCYLKGLRVSDAARCMEKSDAAIRGLLHRGIEALQERVTGAAEPASAAHGARRAAQLAEDARAALLSYLRRREAGERVDAGAFIAEHASCASELRPMLEWVERIEAQRLARLGELGEEGSEER
ncbi:sigma-70 family RNA polymerase sigma factor [Sorangium sp. So ce281]|uniref:sigma-70 family RNA polymerase sigma factor n=1 Tax=unclassified Sorangium TaxID=2621164 RepID=UPI003F62464D